ncbi:YeeE/YedE family protein [Portibacter lacus]|uniref:Transporter n=1 Tax=Portibacter lacus TaxID=1099794 RepID=A0AA37WCJ3_9BACT|nr:DUF6691 family protein [Portibacter lacus]GLR16123.1 transporter [Portibacter lacus]
MKYLKYILIGILFGIVMTKSEAISWFRIQEMFRFESFHMYGIIGTAVILGAIAVQIMKRTQMKTINGEAPKFTIKDGGVFRLIVGGTIFGLGWAMTGACPGPMFVLIGHGVWSILIVIASALLGTFVYGLIKHKLPH